MRDERAKRRPKFCPGIDLRLADSQVWSLPVPEDGLGERELVPCNDVPVGTWNDRTYRAILRAILEAEVEGDLFRAKLALAIHLLNWNYALDQDDFEDLLDDRGESQRRADLAHALNRLALAHLRPLASPAPEAHLHQAPDPDRDDPRRMIDHEASLSFGR